MNSRDDQPPATYPDGSQSISEDSSYHHYRLLESQLERLEGRVHKMYKTQKQTQKTLEAHLLDEATSRDEISRVVNQLNQKVAEMQVSNSKTTRGRNEQPKIAEQESGFVLAEKLQEAQKQMRQQLKQEASRIGKFQKQLHEVIDSQKAMRDGVAERLERSEVQFNKTSQTVLVLEEKFAKQIDEAITSIQQIIKDYLNDQTSLVLQVRSVEDRLQILEKSNLAGRDSELIELTPRDQQHDRKENSAKKKPKEDSRHAYSLPQSNSATKYPSHAFSKPKNQEPQHSSNQHLRAPLPNRDRPATLERQVSNHQSSAEKNLRDRSYSSKKITDLRDKLKQFEQINNKYQHGPPSVDYEDIENAGKSRTSQPLNSSSKQQQQQNLDPKQAIQQLKQFKFLLQHTESDMDISNTFNLNVVGPEPPKPSKYKKVDRLYKDVK